MVIPFNSTIFKFLTLWHLFNASPDLDLLTKFGDLLFLQSLLKLLLVLGLFYTLYLLYSLNQFYFLQWLFYYFCLKSTK